MLTACSAPARTAALPVLASTVADVDRLLALVDAALGTGGRRPRVVLDAADPAIAHSGLAAATVSSADGAPPRLVLDPAAIAGGGEATEVLLAHEMVHVRLQPVTSPATPLWAVEGFADLIAFQLTGADPWQLRGLAGSLGSPAAPPEDDDFTGAPAKRDVAYAQSLLLWEVLVERAGEAVARQAYDALAAAGDPAAFDAAIAAAGLTTSGLLAGWQQRIVGDG